MLLLLLLWLLCAASQCRAELEFGVPCAAITPTVTLYVNILNRAYLFVNNQTGASYTTGGGDLYATTGTTCHGDTSDAFDIILYYTRFFVPNTDDNFAIYCGSGDAPSYSAYVPFYANIFTSPYYSVGFPSAVTSTIISDRIYYTCDGNQISGAQTRHAYYGSMSQAFSEAGQASIYGSADRGSGIAVITWGNLNTTEYASTQMPASTSTPTTTAAAANHTTATTITNTTTTTTTTTTVTTTTTTMTTTASNASSSSSAGVDLSSILSYLTLSTETWIMIGGAAGIVILALMAIIVANIVCPGTSLKRLIKRGYSRL